MESDDGAESCVSPFAQFSTNSVSKTKQPEDRMDELISLQKSSGMFEISLKDWTGTALDFYLGKYEDVQSKCPSGVAINLWFTALAITIMEIKMSEKKELWELVAQKSKKSLNVELKKNKEQFQALLDKAEEYAKSKLINDICV
jgi:hypothetical protein